MTSFRHLSTRPEDEILPRIFENTGEAPGIPGDATRNKELAPLLSAFCGVAEKRALCPGRGLLANVDAARRQVSPNRARMLDAREPRGHLLVEEGTARRQ